MMEELRNKYKVPFSCPLCRHIMRGKSTSTYLKFGVCVECTIEFVEGREERWKTGWRPTEEQLQTFIARSEQS